MLGIRTRDRRMVGADESTELWPLSKCLTRMPLRDGKAGNAANKNNKLFSQLNFG